MRFGYRAPFSYNLFSQHPLFYRLIFFFFLSQGIPKEFLVNYLDRLVRRKICKKLDLKHPLGTDYRELADHFKIPNEDIRTISENSDPTDKLLERLWDNPKNTIAKLREVLACQYLPSSRSLTMVFLGYYGT